MSRYLNTRTSIPWKALGQRKIWSDPILIETKLPGTFVQRKDAKEDPLLWQPKLWNPLFYLLLDTKTTGLATVIWKFIAAVLTTTPGHSLNRRGHLCPGLPRNIGVPTILRTSRFSVTSLFVSLTRRGFKIQQFWCTAKNRSPLYYFSLYIFITSQKDRCKTHSACIALKALLHSHWILQSSRHFSRSLGAQCVL